MHMIRNYQESGHEMAKLDPLELQDQSQHGPHVPKHLNRLHHSYYGFSDKDLDREFYLDHPEQMGFLGQKKRWVLKDLIDGLKKSYCSSIGVEYLHLSSEAEKRWIREQIEGSAYRHPSKEEKLLIHDRLSWSVLFAEFLATKFNTMKRFGLSGIDSFIPGIKATIDVLVSHGFENVIMGMPHRGRLNVLANVVRKPLEHIFNEF